MKNIIKKILCIMTTLLTIILLVINIIRFNKVFILPLLFEIFILIFSYLKYRKDNIIKSNIIIVIKNIILFATLIMGLVGINNFINETVMKLLLTITIVLQIIVYLQLINFKKTKRV